MAFQRFWLNLSVGKQDLTLTSLFKKTENIVKVYFSQENTKIFIPTNYLSSETVIVDNRDVPTL